MQNTKIESKINTHGNSRDEIRDLGKQLDDLTELNITAFSPHYKKLPQNPATVVTIVQDLPPESPESKVTSPKSLKTEAYKRLKEIVFGR